MALSSSFALSRRRSPSLLTRCRRPWTGWVQVVAAAFMILSPLPSALASNWSDSDSDGHNDRWYDPQNELGISLAELNAYSIDVDNDGATNDEEAAEGSDPFSFDTDYDGISDGDELHIVKPLIGTSLNNWDTDGDTYSDYDEWYNFSGVTYPGGQLPNFQNASYSDYDGDGYKNPVDPYPTDPYNGNGDSDGDGITDLNDPFPSDGFNYSSINNIAWGGSLFNDDDSDGIVNWQDPSPYDVPPPPPPDTDGDGIPDPQDPVLNDSSNPSPYNGLTWWYTSAINDDDSDGIQNFSDPYAGDASNYCWRNNTAWYGYVTADADSDSVLNYLDPFPNDSTNFSSSNNVAWYGDMFGDADYDTVQNWQDGEPYGYQPPPPPPMDTDGDGFNDNIDPFVSDATNHSSYNNITWYGQIFADDDGDLTPNWMDSTPFIIPDADSDGIPDGNDPAPNDASNTSPNNGAAWWGDALSDPDGDGFANFYDPFPNDTWNLSPINGQTWGYQVLNDEDSDGLANWQDAYPYDPYNDPDVDGDGLTGSQEVSYGTSDSDVDCDDDGLTDYEELIVYSTNPLNAYDLSQELGWGDLYTDYQLVESTDTDGDTIPDRIELFYGLAPNNAEDGYGDLDGNGMNNRVQYSAGLALNVDLSFYDQDGDGLTDIFEDYYGLDKASFADAMFDADGDAVLNFEEGALLFSPLNYNTRELEGFTDLYFLVGAMLYPAGIFPEWEDENNNNYPDWYDDALEATTPRFTRVAPGDLDGDGMPDVWEHTHGRWKYPTSGLFVRHDDSAVDADSDSLTNLQEYQLGTNPLIADTNGDGTSDGDGDADGDGLTNAQEGILGSNPNSSDSDGDGMSDGWENENGLDLLTDDANGNADGDHLTNKEEYANGLNPQDGADNLQWVVYTRYRVGYASPNGFLSFDPIADPQHYRVKTYTGSATFEANGTQTEDRFGEVFPEWSTFHRETTLVHSYSHEVEWTHSFNIPIMTGYIYANPDPELPFIDEEYTVSYSNDLNVERTLEQDGYVLFPTPHTWYSDRQDQWHHDLSGDYEGEGQNVGVSSLEVTGNKTHAWASQSSSQPPQTGGSSPAWQTTVSITEAGSWPNTVNIGDWSYAFTFEFEEEIVTPTELTSTSPAHIDEFYTDASDLDYSGELTHSYELSEPITVDDILQATRQDLLMCEWSEWVNYHALDIVTYYDYLTENDYPYGVTANQNEYYIRLESMNGTTLTNIEPRVYRWLEKYQPEEGTPSYTQREATLVPGQASATYLMDPMAENDLKSGHTILVHPGLVDLHVSVGSIGVPNSVEEEPGAFVPANVGEDPPLVAMLVPVVPSNGTYSFKFPGSVRIWRDSERVTAVQSEQPFIYNPYEVHQYFVEFTQPAGAGPQPSTVELIWKGSDPGGGPEIELKDSVRLLPVELMTKGHNGEIIPQAMTWNSVSTPVITCSATSVTLSEDGTTALVSISGTVTDDTSDCTPTLGKQLTHLYIHGDTPEIAVSLTNSATSNPENIWRPYAWESEFNQTVSMPIKGTGDYTIDLRTSENAGGLIGTSSVSIRVCTGPASAPNYRIVFPQGYVSTQTNLLNLKIGPNPETANTVTLSETGAGTKQFIGEFNNTTYHIAAHNFTGLTQNVDKLDVTLTISSPSEEQETLRIVTRETEGPNEFTFDPSAPSPEAATIVTYNGGTDAGNFQPTIVRIPVSPGEFDSPPKARIMDREWTIKHNAIHGAWFVVDDNDKPVVFNPSLHSHSDIQTHKAGSSGFRIAMSDSSGTPAGGTALEVAQGLVVHNDDVSDLLFDVTNWEKKTVNSVNGGTIHVYMPKTTDKLGVGTQYKATATRRDDVYTEILYRYIGTKNTVAIFNSREELTNDLRYRYRVTELCRKVAAGDLPWTFGDPSTGPTSIWGVAPDNMSGPRKANFDGRLFLLKPGVDVWDAWADPFIHPEQYTLGCLAAKRLILGYAAQEVVPRTEWTDLISMSTNTRAGGSHGNKLTRLRQSPNRSRDEDPSTAEDKEFERDWIPGDAGYIRHQREYQKKKNALIVGENIIYLGGAFDQSIMVYGDFFGFLDGGVQNVQPLVNWVHTVRRFTGESTPVSDVKIIPDREWLQQPFDD